jgi:DNA ligase D-like protein (predicted 3'-phosphoesterase)
MLKGNFAIYMNDLAISLRFNLDIYDHLGQNTVTFQSLEQAPDKSMAIRFVVHQHQAGRSHFDIRIVENGVLRSWSLLKTPPLREGEKRLAIERENFPIESMDYKIFEENAFGLGRVSPWDSGEAEFKIVSPTLIIASLSGMKLSGAYEFRRMRWYPGNRWMLTKLRN